MVQIKQITRTEHKERVTIRLYKARLKDMKVFDYVGELQPAGQVANAPSAMYLTAPAFLADGRLVYLRWHTIWRQREEPFPHREPEYRQTHGGEKAEVEVWVADERGRNGKRWLKLPNAHVRSYVDESERLFAVSADGRTIAFVRNNVIKIMRVAPPK